MNSSRILYIVMYSWALVRFCDATNFQQPTAGMIQKIASADCQNVVWQNIDFSNVVFKPYTKFNNARIIGCRMYGYKTPQPVVVPQPPAVCGNPVCIPVLPPLPMPPLDPFVLPEIPALPGVCDQCSGDTSGQLLPPVESKSTIASAASDFTGAIFKDATLTGTSFYDDVHVAGANLSGADLSNAFLVGTDFTNCTLGDATLTGAILGSTVKGDMTTKGATFNFVDLSKVKGFDTIKSLRMASFDGASLTKLKFPLVDACGMQAQFATLDGARLGGLAIRTDYTAANFSGCSCVGTQITNITAVGSLWSGIYVDKTTRFNTSNLSGSSFKELQPRLDSQSKPIRDKTMGCTFNNCTLTGASFYGINIGGLTIQGGSANGVVFDAIKAPDLDTYPWTFNDAQLYAALFGGANKQMPYISLGGAVFNAGVDLTGTRFQFLDTCSAQFQTTEFPLAVYVNTDGKMEGLSAYRSSSCQQTTLPDTGF